MVISDIAGDLSRQDLALRKEQLRAKLEWKKPIEIDGFINGLPAKYRLMFGEEFLSPVIVLDMRSVKKIGEFVPPEQLPKRMHHDHYFNMQLSRPIAHFFPHHGAALLTYNSIPDFEKDIPFGPEIMKNLGYELFTRPRYLSGANWNNEMRLRLLSVLRDPKSNLAAADVRAVKILQTLYENIDVDPLKCAFTLAEYAPKLKSRQMTEEEWYDQFDGFSPEGGPQKIEWKPRKVKKLINIGARESLLGGLEWLCTGLALTRAMGISSLVKTPEGIRHIPMIDFEGRESGRYGEPGGITEEQANTIRTLGIPGMIVDSGKSFHFYGFTFLTKREWKDMMCLINEMPGVDEFWPDLSLKQGYSLVRLTPSRYKLTQPAISHFTSQKGPGKRSLDLSFPSSLPTKTNFPAKQPYSLV